MGFISMRFRSGWRQSPLSCCCFPIPRRGPGEARATGSSLTSPGTTSNDDTLQKLRQFLGDNDLASISTWADDIRSGRPETGPWHYVDIPPDSAGYEPKDCPDDNCVVAQINQFARILGDPQQPFAARSEALKFLVHFVGDLSQPFHAMADARGGNDIPVTVFGSTQCGDYACNLHSVWDSELIQHTGLREHRYARELEEMIATDHLQAGFCDPVAWANESLQLAKQAWVQPQTKSTRPTTCGSGRWSTGSSPWPACAWHGC